LTEYSTQATRYQQARSAGIHSVASHASLWTGRPVAEHGATRHHDSVSADATIWTDLSDIGYQTGLFTGNVIVAHTSNLAAPFDDVVTNNYVDTDTKIFAETTDVKPKEGYLGNIKRCATDKHPLKSFFNAAYYVYLKRRYQSIKKLESQDFINAFLQWQRDQTGPWAACINLLDTHAPYEPSAEHDLWDDGNARSIQSSLGGIPSIAFTGDHYWSELASLEDLYDGTIHEADTHVRRLVRELKSADVHDDTLVVVTSDHGEGFGERSHLTDARMVDHSWGLHEVLTHVPLIVKYPGQTEGRVISEPVSLTAFADTARTAATGDVNTWSFLEADRPVVASTERLLREDTVIFKRSSEDPTDYFGPWRAVYRFEDGVVRKYLRRGDQSAIVEVPSAQDQTLVERDDHGVVDEVFDEIYELVEVLDTGESEGASEAVKRELSELGYLT
jgi:arylsulfatase A-like enzyme